MRAAVTFGNDKRLASYLAALEESGIEGVPNPASLNSLDGLLLTGGSDINPKRYGQENAGSDEVDDARDELEIRLLQEALAADLPVLGICRGLQLFNVACGGTLVQHLASTDVHRQKPQECGIGEASGGPPDLGGSGYAIGRDHRRRRARCELAASPGHRDQGGERDRVGHFGGRRD